MSTPAGLSAGPVDSRQRADLPTSALGMAIDARGTGGQIPGGIIHGDHGTQFTSWIFTERARRAGLLPSLGSVDDPHDKRCLRRRRGVLDAEANRIAGPAALAH